MSVSRAGRMMVSWGFALLLLAPCAAAFPSIYGVNGLYRTVSADVGSPGSFSFFISALYQKATVHNMLRFRVEHAGVDTVLEVYDFEHYLDGMVQFGLALNENVEMGVTVSYLVNAFQYDQVHIRRDYVGVMDLGWGFGDVTGAVKYGRQVHPMVDIGGMAWLGWPVGEIAADTVGDSDGYWEQGVPRMAVRRPFRTTGNPSWGFMGLATGRYSDLEMNLNLGYSSYRQEYTDSVIGSVNQSDHSIDMGAGIAYRAPQAILYLEYTRKSFLSRADDAGYADPSRVTVGVRLFEETGSFLDIAGEYGFTDYDRFVSDPARTGILRVPGGVPGDWGVMLALGFDSDMSGVMQSDDGTGTVVGTITDTADGSPLAGQVSFPDRPISPTVSDSVSGFFSAPVLSGTVVARAEVDGYVPLSVTLVVESGATVPTDFRMVRAAPAEGQVHGSVTDASTGMPLAASLTVEGGSVSASASAEGVFSLALPSGSHSLRASMPGYMDAVKTVSVSGGGAVPVDLAMSRELVRGEVLSFANIYFESGSSVLQPESFAVLDEVAGLLAANQNVSVQVTGHTDSEGSVQFNQTLSEARAASVRTYLIQSGMSSARISASGMGESDPVDSNSTPQGRARNRRIEFMIL